MSRGKVRSGSGQSAVAVELSENRKLGKISATYVSQASCPRDCPWYGRGCYAELGYVGMKARQLNVSGERRAERLARAEARGIGRLSGRRLLRLHVVGDARTDAAARVLGKASEGYAMRRDWEPRAGRKVWTYTHAWRGVSRGSWGGAVSVLASVESVGEAREAMGRGYAVAMVVGEFEREQAYEVGKGLKVVPCPAQTREGVTCKSCGLCRDDERLRAAGLVIGFAAHGVKKGEVKRRLVSLQTV